MKVDIPAGLVTRLVLHPDDATLAELRALLPPVRECPRCGVQFVFQDGRATQGKNRTTGVIYCSKACANAQAQAEFRRRNREAK